MEKILNMNVRVFGFVLNNILDGDTISFTNVLLQLKERKCPFRKSTKYYEAWAYLHKFIVKESSKGQEEIRHTSRPICAYNTQGDLDSEYTSIAAAYRTMGTSYDNDKSIWLSATDEDEFVIAHERIWRFRDSVTDQDGNVIKKLFKKDA